MEQNSGGTNNDPRVSRKELYCTLGLVVVLFIGLYLFYTRPDPCECNDLRLICPQCGYCIPVMGAGTVSLQECECCNVISWQFKCRTTGKWFSVSQNECDRIVWGAKQEVLEGIKRKAQLDATIREIEKMKEAYESDTSSIKP